MKSEKAMCNEVSSAAPSSAIDTLAPYNQSRVCSTHGRINDTLCCPSKAAAAASRPSGKHPPGARTFPR